jgi:uncharacterized protein (DUF58 family)
MNSSPARDELFGFDSEFLQRLERLALLSRRPLQGPLAGPRRSPQHGSSVEFADFRNYTAGDDFRRIDWNAYARLDRLFLHLYSAEQMSTVTILLDHSLSMSFGEPSKVLTGARLGAVLSYVALRNYDRVAVLGWGTEPGRYLPVQSGTRATPRVWRFLADLLGNPSSGTDFHSLVNHVQRHPGRGLAVVLSDFLTDSDWKGGLRSLRAAGQEVTAIQILSSEDLNPTVRGDWALHDAESGTEVEVTISPRLLRRYEEELAAHTSAIRAYCRSQQIGFLQMSSDISFPDLVLTSLRNAGVLR